MLARLGDFAAGSGIARRWRRYERREDGTRRCAVGRRFLTHFVRPFSIAHLRRRKAFGFPFHLSLGSPLACSPLSVSAWLVLSPFPVASYSPCVAWGDMPRRVGGAIWLLVPRPVPSSRSAARSISPYRIASRMRAPFLSAHSPASFVGGWSYRFPFRLVPRLACPSRVGVSCLFFAARLSIRFISSICWRLVAPFRPAVPALSSCSSFLDISPCPAPRSPSRAIRLARASRQAVRILSFRPGVSSRRLAGRVVFSVSFYSFLIVSVRCVS